MSQTPANSKQKVEPLSKTKRSIPWWAFLSAAIFCYCLFKYVLPNLTDTTGNAALLLFIYEIAAPILAILFLLLAANALYGSPSAQQVPNGRKSQEDEDESG